MNREIKFRAWIKSAEKMVRVYTMCWKYDCLELICVSAGLISHSSYEINDVEIMEHIGLEDANGVEIYEGDIVSLNWTEGKPRPFIVTWSEPYGRFRFILGRCNGPGLDILKECKARACLEPINWEANYHSKCMVVGNIYENPELLEVD